MGIKEESSKIRIVKGYSGQLKPGQTKAGKCSACRKPVFVDNSANASVPHSEPIKLFHYSCAAL